MSSFDYDSSLNSSTSSVAAPDLIVISGSHRFDVHKSVVCPFSNSFATGSAIRYQEDGLDLVDLSDYDPSCVTRMLQFFYKGSFDDHDGERRHIPDQLLNTIRVYHLAAKYDIQELQNFTTDHFIELADKNAWPCPYAYILADAVFEFTRKFIDDARAISLRKCIARVCASHAKFYLQYTNVKREWKLLVEENDEFVAAFWEAGFDRDGEEV